MRVLLIIVALFSGSVLWAQDVVPKAKTKEQRKAERKKMTLEEKIEDALPVDVTLPTAKAKVGNNTIGSKEDLKRLKEGAIDNLEDAKKYVTQTVPNYGKEVKERVKKAKKDLKKGKEKLFDGKNYKGLAVEKKIIKRGSGSRLFYQEFYVLKEHQNPLPYQREMTWYEDKRKKLHSNVYSRDPQTHSLLHGSFREYRGDNLVKEGYYYLGVKDERWMEYSAKDNTLLEKETYNKGFLKESKISYYNGDSTKIKEVIPIKYGKTTGEYLRFYEDGTLAEKGEYDDGKKIGKWREYHEGGGNRMKKEIQFPFNFFDETEPYTVVEYDAKGKKTLENRKSN